MLGAGVFSKGNKFSDPLHFLHSEILLNIFRKDCEHPLPQTSCSIFTATCYFFELWDYLWDK